MSLIAILAEAAHGDEHGTGGEGLFPPFDPAFFPSQLFWLTITFGGLYLVLSRMILPRLSANLEHRSDTIADDLDEAARLNEQAQEAQQTLELSLAQARSKARDTAQAAEAEMAEEIAAETRKVDEALDGKLQAAEVRISELRAEAMSSVQSVATEVAGTILARLGLTANEADVDAAVKSAITGKG